MDREKASELARDFVLSGMLVAGWDRGSPVFSALIDTANAILAESREIITGAIDRFIEEKEGNEISDDAFLNSLLPVYYRIWYEAYAPYWLSHCHPDTSNPEYTYYNDLIEMYWSWKHQAWEEKGGKAVTIMLPPTKGLVDLAYKEDIGSFEIYMRTHTVAGTKCAEESARSESAGRTKTSETPESIPVENMKGAHNGE